MAKLPRATVGRRYARALFELTHADQTDETTLAELLTLQDVLSTNPQLMQALTSVSVPDAAKQELLTTMTKDASTLVQHLIEMVYENRRIADLPTIIVDYKLLVDQAMQVVTAEVTTAVALEDDQAERLSAKLKDMFNAQEIVLEQQVDPTILGGVKVEANNRVIDGSLATKLANIRQSIIG